ncbi:hypothetical protein NL676_038214 [Syzygium grande]|nr:hypothetical protein NL676_038214 [Syzygium grande]
MATPSKAVNGSLCLSFRPMWEDCRLSHGDTIKTSKLWLVIFMDGPDRYGLNVIAYYIKAQPPSRENLIAVFLLKKNGQSTSRCSRKACGSLQTAEDSPSRVPPHACKRH